VSGRLYKQLGGETWVWNTVLTGWLLCGPVFCVWAVLNSIAWAYGSAQALPASTVAILLSLWLLGACASLAPRLPTPRSLPI
jgi:transmembrane 9 superfamily protein 1